MQEVWKDIDGFIGLYQISNLGRVKSLNRFDSLGRQWSEKLLKTQVQPRGYCVVRLRKDGKDNTKMIHRLVAIAFIPNPNNLSDVKHLDENLLNNCVYNLQWYNHSRAITYGNHYRRIKDRPKICKSDIWNSPVLKFSRNGKTLIQKYDTVMQANRSLKRSLYSYSIINCLNGKSKTSGGYVWKYDIR